MIKIKRKLPVWNLHTHSRYSANDALPTPRDIVNAVADMGQPAIGLTDHGNMAGSIQLYNAAQSRGIKPFPGTELYIVDDRENTKAKRHHMGIVAYTTEGYKNLVKISTLSHKNFHNKPLLDFSDLAGLSEAGLTKGIAATSGCYFGFVSQAVVKEDESALKSYLHSFNNWFDKFYVELQNHNIEQNGWTDEMVSTYLWDVAREMGLPCILTQDSHYIKKEDRNVHESLKRMVAYGSDAEDAVFPGDGYHLADEQWFRDHHKPALFNSGIEGLRDLLGAHDLEIPELDNYKYRIPFTTADPDTELRTTCIKKLESLGLLKGEYKERLESEFDIILDTGMAGYLLLVKEVTDWCKDNKIFYQARGSASGSIVCWMLGITQVDPVKWKLRFERFISRDRTKPPDIDLDVEHLRRQELIEWLETRFSVNQIGTWLEHSITGDDEESKGSLRVRYYARQKMNGVTNPVPWNKIPQEDRDMLKQISQFSPYNAYGTHAAGLVVTTTSDEFNSLVPLMMVASSKTLVSQYDMGDVEKLGLVKLDVLGLKTLSILNKAMINLDKDPLDGLDWIPLDDSKTFTAISKGRTEGVFQLEGISAKYGCMELKPNKITDIVAAMALFRPATMDSGATKTYIKRKHKEESIPEMHQIISKNTKATYGIMLFQEQVISILRDLGMDADNLTSFLKAVKSSNSDIGDAGGVIAGYKSRVQEMSVEKGMNENDFAWLWEAIEGFAAYGFNQAHSVAYGLTAYRCAYLAQNHPIEFFAAVLSVAAGTDKEQNYIAAARKYGVRILSSDVQYSGVTYTVDKKRKSIRKGLLSIKGVGEKAAIEIINARPDGGWKNKEDFASTVSHRKVTGIKALKEGDSTVGTIGKLHESGALESLYEAV